MKVQEQIETPKGASLWRKAVHGLAVFALAIGLIPVNDRPAQAMFGTKTLTILHMHTGESATITFARGGRYDQQALDRLNWLLRDWRTDEPTRMDPRLFDLLAEVYDESGSRQPIRVVSAYRSPKTNSMLRRRSRMVAEHSQHMLGKALDFYLSDVSPEKVRAIGMKLQEGGVGYYPNSNTPFTHLDVGSVRAWPRMTRAQLNNLFPNGKTVHIPADGRPLPGYDEAKAMILARGGKVAGSGYSEVAEAQPKRKGFWATLFGSRDEEDDEEDARTSRGVLASRNRPQQVAVNDAVDSDRPASFFANQQRQPAVDDQPAPPRAAAAAPVAKPEPSPVAPSEPVPLPPVRQVATVAATPSGPQMVWQAGPSGQPNSPPKGNPFSAATGQIALAPNAARKTGDDLRTGAMTYAPLPPARPGAAKAAVAQRGGTLADAPIMTASINRAPKPAARPGVAPVKTASLPPAPAKPGKDKAKAKQPAPAKVAAPAKAASGKGNKPAVKSAGPVKQAPLRPKPVAASGSGFSKTASDLSTSRFTGSALKPTARR